jgi:arylsulfatase A-like enzyme
VEFMGPVENFIQQCIMNLYGRSIEEEYFVPRVFKAAARWLQENQDADQFFLTIESFDPHEPWLVPAHYREMYPCPQGIEQVISVYGDISKWDQAYLQRTRANYSGLVSLCDRWFGYFMESLRVLDLLEDTLILVTSDHGHSLGEENYIGKRGYPSRPEVYEVPLMVRYPGGENGGSELDAMLQHVDISATILDAANAPLPASLDGYSFLEAAARGETEGRDHITIGWGSTPTVITDGWWFNSKVDGTGVFLYDLNSPDPFSQSVADDHRDQVDRHFALAKSDADEKFPDWLIDLAKNEADAPGCSALAARG